MKQPRRRSTSAFFPSFDVFRTHTLVAAKLECSKFTVINTGIESPGSAIRKRPRKRNLQQVLSRRYYLNSKEMSKIEQFERVIVFRSARFLPLLLSVVATVMLVIAGFALLYAIIPSWKPKQPAPVPEPPQVAVTGSEITDYLNRSAQVASPSTQPNAANQPGNAGQNSNASSVPVVSPDAKSIANELDAIRKQALALSLPWANEYQTVCQQVFFGNCYNQRTVMSSRGVSGYIDQAFGHHNDGTVPVETVQVGDQSYRVNSSHHDAKLAILKELETVLASAQAENARKLLNAWGKIREEKERDRDKALRSEQERRDQAYASAQMRYETTVEKKHRIRSTSIYVVSMALGGFVLLGLILAVLAVERHTRLLEAQLASAKGEAAPISSPVANP